MPHGFSSGQIYTVSGLTELVRRSLENNFPFVWVRGEVTDFSLSSSSHMYFSLKDGNSLLQCVWFAGRRAGRAGTAFDPLTGEVFDTPRPSVAETIRNGMEIVCAGSINVYARSGRYQLIVEHAEAAGAGLLSIAFEQLRAKLAALGYFALERKRPLPSFPQRVALVTSPHGAAIHDFLKLASSRGLSSRIRVFPVTVQGRGAAEKMAQAIREANAQNWAEVIVLVRGGGSAEDLMEFNEEALATAIFESRLPVLAGIGHEVDVFLADMTADMRAATPSHAAQILWPLRGDLWQKLDEERTALDNAIGRLFKHLDAEWTQKARALGWLSPGHRLQRLEEKWSGLDERLLRGGGNLVPARSKALSLASSSFRKALRLRQKISFSGQAIQFRARAAQTAMRNNLNSLSQRLEGAEKRGREAIMARFASREAMLEKLAIILENRNPYLPLQKGYALLRSERGIIRSVRECRRGDLLDATLADGLLNLEVRQILKDSNKDAV